MVPFSASRPAVYHSLVLFLPGSPQLPAGGRSRRASSSALCLWLLALRPACGRSPTSVSWGVGACVHMGVCVCAHPHTGTSHTPRRPVETTSTWARKYTVWWLPVTEHVLPSLGALGGHSQPQAHPEGSPPSWHRPTLQMTTWAGTGAHLVSESA